MVSILTKEQMKKLNTKRLLAYKNSLMQVPESGTPWDHSEWTAKKLGSVCVDGCCFAKDNPVWKKVYADLKEILATREHVER